MSQASGAPDDFVLKYCEDKMAPEHFNWLHSIAVDSEGSVYAAEVSFCECGKFQRPHAREMVSLRKWRLVRP